MNLYVDCALFLVDWFLAARAARSGAQEEPRARKH
jgi:hypothetical protein